MPSQFLNSWDSRLPQFSWGAVTTNAIGALDVATPGAAGTILTSNGATAKPTFKAPATSSITISGNTGSTTGTSFTFTGGTSGAVFTMAAGTMTESFNYLSLPTTTSTNGQILINAVPALQMYGTANIFAGGAGNFTLTSTRTVGIGAGATLGGLTNGGNNTGIGYRCLHNIQTGGNNTFLGDTAGYGITGSNNTGIGASCLQGTGGAGNNCGLGYYAGYQAAGVNNVFIGYNAGANSVNGSFSNNCLIGYNCGSAYVGAEASNILIGSSVTGVAAESNKCRIGAATGSGAGQLTDTYLYGTVHGDTLITVPSTTSTKGQYQIGGLTVLHVFNGSGNGRNTFVGGESGGNFSCTGDGNNVSIGFQSGKYLTSGQLNAFCGMQAGLNATTGSYNCHLGHAAGQGLVGGSYNTCLGDSSGSNYGGSESSNICLGANVAGTNGESNVFRVGNGTGTGNGQLNKAVISGIYNKAVGATAGMVLIDSTDVMGSVPYVPTTAWTPTLKFGGNSVDMTYGTQTGTYCRTGGVVTFTMNIVLTEAGSSTGNATITGLPVAAAAVTALSVDYCELNIQDIQLTATLSGSTISLYAPVAGAARSPVTHASFEDTTDLVISGTYIV